MVSKIWNALRLFFLLIFILAALDFFTHNEEPIRIYIPYYGLQLPRYDAIEVKAYMAFMLWFFLGSAITGLFYFNAVFWKSLEMRRLRREIKRLTIAAENAISPDSTVVQNIRRRWRFW